MVHMYITALLAVASCTEVHSIISMLCPLFTSHEPIYYSTMEIGKKWKIQGNNEGYIWLKVIIWCTWWQFNLYFGVMGDFLIKFLIWMAWTSWLPCLRYLVFLNCSPYYDTDTVVWSFLSSHFSPYCMAFSPWCVW